MNEPRNKNDGTGLSRAASAGIVAAALGFTAVLAMRNAPDPLHPRIRRWYKRLDKPSYTPPDPVFGGVWPVVESGLAVGGYRLLRTDASPSRNLAVGLWVVNVGMIGGWTEIFSPEGAWAERGGIGRDGGDWCWLCGGRCPGRPDGCAERSTVCRLAGLRDIACRADLGEKPSVGAFSVTSLTVWHDGACHSVPGRSR